MTVYAASCGLFLASLPILFGSADFFGQMGSVLALGMGALGSAIGIGLAGQAAAGAWAKEARAGRNLSFTYIILAGMPISQTLYAMIVMNNMSGAFGERHVHVGTVRPAVRNRIGHRIGRNAVRLDARYGRRGRDPSPERWRRQRIRVRHHRDGDRRDRRNLRDGVHAGDGAQLADDCQATAPPTGPAPVGTRFGDYRAGPRPTAFRPPLAQGRFKSKGGKGKDGGRLARLVANPTNEMHRERGSRDDRGRERTGVGSRFRSKPPPHRNPPHENDS
jgi:F0F1-type ATP synthase membrane subunit c/vacuolar-type H+-ATPase subunit K